MIKINNVPFQFHSMGYMENSISYLHPQLCQDWHKMIFVVTGTVSIVSGGISYTLEKGDVLSIPPGTLHYGSLESHGKISFYYLHFYCKDMSIFESLPILMHNYGNTHKLRELYHHYLTPNIPEYIKAVKCADILYDICIAEANATDKKSKKIVSEILEWIPANPRDAATIKGVAAHFGYSTDHLVRLFRSQLNMDLKDYIRDCRIEQSKNLLLNTTDTIKDIAEKMGFLDSNAFVKYFKYYEHCTPTEFRNKYFKTYICSN